MVSAPPHEAAHLSIVVLPFANLSGDASQDYFADGVTENLTTDLSRLAGASVIARSTAFTFKGKNIDAKAIGSSSAFAMCSKARSSALGSTYASTPSLISAESGAHLWAQSFDKSVGDLFARAG